MIDTQQQDMAPIARQTYAQRAAKHANPAAKALLETIERKRTNLSVSVDVTKKADFLRIIDAVGPYVCLVKVRTAKAPKLIRHDSKQYFADPRRCHRGLRH